MANLETGKEQPSVVREQTKQFDDVMDGKKIQAVQLIGGKETMGDPLEELKKTMEEFKKLILLGKQDETYETMKKKLVGQLETVINMKTITDVTMINSLTDLKNKLMSEPDIVTTDDLESMMKSIEAIRDPELTKSIENALKTPESALFFEIFQEALMPVGNHDVSANKLGSYVHQGELTDTFYDKVKLLWLAKNNNVDKKKAQATFDLLLSNLSHQKITDALTKDPSFKDTLKAIAIQQCAHKMVTAAEKPNAQQTIPAVLRQGMTSMSPESAWALATQYFDTGVLKLVKSPLLITGEGRAVKIKFKVVGTPLFDVKKDKDGKEISGSAMIDSIASLRNTISTKQQTLQVALDKKKPNDQTEQEKKNITILSQQQQRLSILINILKKDISSLKGSDNDIAVINMIYGTSYTNKDNLSTIRDYITKNPPNDITIGRVVTMIAGSSLNLLPSDKRFGTPEDITMVSFDMQEKEFTLPETPPASTWTDISTNQIFVSGKSDLDNNSRIFVQKAEKQLADDMIIQNFLKKPKTYTVTITAHTDSTPYIDATSIIQDYKDHEAMYQGTKTPAMTPHQKQAREEIKKAANNHPNRGNGNKELAIDRAYEQYKEFTKNLPQDVLNGTNTQKVKFTFDVKETQQRLGQIDIKKQ